MRERIVHMRVLVVSLVVLGATLDLPAQVGEYAPVTDAVLLNPGPANWIHFRRTIDGQGYSPLNQINRQNVQNLQLVWSWALHPGASEPTPHVYNGIMFISNPGGGVQALDAASGDLLWDWKVTTASTDRSSPGGAGPGNLAIADPMRNLAFYGDKVFTATGRDQGALLVALDARTGAVSWQKRVGYRHTAGPIAVKGKVIVGTNGCEQYKTDDPPCFIAGFDPNTGRELWRTSTIARPGEPGGDTWDDLPLMFRAGGDVWQSGSYDPRTNLTYWGTAQPKPWARFQRGTDGDALYTNSTLALDVDTGKLAWHFQHLPGDTTDSDEAFERLLIDYDGKSSVFSMGKLGVLWENDRGTGAFRAAHDLGYQDLISIDPKTGRAAYFPDKIPRPGVELKACSSIGGFRAWRAMAYHPATRAVYIPLNLTCRTATYESQPERVVGGGGLGRTIATSSRFHPESPRTLGEFVSMDIRTGGINWRYRTPTPMNTSALTTGGGLVIVGDFDRNVYFFDANTGKLLYRTRMPSPTNGTPTTFAVRGRQYIAIPVGTGSTGIWTSVPEQLTPDKMSQPYAERMNGVFVFALGDAPPR